MASNSELAKRVEQLESRIKTLTSELAQRPADRTPAAGQRGIDPAELDNLRATALWGRVVLPPDADDGADLSGVEVKILVEEKETTAKLAANGVFQIPSPGSPGPVRIRAGTVQQGGRTFVPDPPVQTVQFDPGVPFDGVVIPYRGAQAEIRVAPRLRPVQGDSEPLPGVTVELFAGPGATKRLRSVTTSATRSQVVFSELTPGLYTLVTTGPTVYEGTPLRMVDPGRRVRPVQVDAGQVVVLESGHDFAAVTVGEIHVEVLDADNDAPLKDVPVELVSVVTDRPVFTGTTADNGCVAFQRPPVGSYVVRLAEAVVSAEGRRWTLSQPAAVSVRDGDPAARVRLRLRPEEHVVYGPVLDGDDTPLPHVRLVARSYPDGEELATFVSDERGEYRWVAPYPGTFSIAVSQVDGEPERLVPVSVNSSIQNPVRVAGHPLGGGAGGPGTNGFRRGVLPTGRRGVSSDPGDQTFPLLVDEVDLAGSTPGGRAGRVGGGAGSGQVVESALRDVLGYRARKEDPRGFLAALTQAFSCYEVRGQRECRWTPRGYAATVQADLGALTGAQASIFERAKIAVDAALPILDRLRPLDPSADEENVGASRAIVRSRLEELPRELGAEGGPRVLRVDDLFLRLLGSLTSPVTVEGLPPVDADDPLSSELGQLRDDLGMDRTRINTIEEEANFTDFLMLVDHIGTLLSTWVQQRAFFDREPQFGEQPFLGTQLVLLSRQLEVVAETVGETYFVMDSVFLGAAERQTLELISFSGGTRTRITVAELLDWVESFATEEGPRLIRDGGVSGVRSFAPTVVRLAELVDEASTAAQLERGNTGLPPSYRTARVQQALTQLAQQLAAAAALAGAFQVNGAFVPVDRRRGGRR